MRKKKTDQQKDRDKKGKDRIMSYYMRKKLESEGKVAPVEDDSTRVTFWQKRVDANGDGDWVEKIYER